MSHYGIDQDEVGLELMTAKRFLHKSNGKLDFIMSIRCYLFLRVPHVTEISKDSYDIWCELSNSRTFLFFT